MENYVLDGAMVLSKDNIAGTDNLITSAIENMPISAVAGIMPVSKTRGPASQWVEPFYKVDDNGDNKIIMVSTPVVLDEEPTRQRLTFSCLAADELRRTYTPEAFTHLVQNWVSWYRNSKHRKQLSELLKSPAIAGLPYNAAGPGLIDITDDKVEAVKNQIIHCITSLSKRFQLGDMHFSVVGPYEAAWSVLEVQNKVPGKLHFMGDDTLDDLYIFPTGTHNMSRAGFVLFDYADAIQRTHDSSSGEEVYFIYNRSRVVLNPIHRLSPIVEKVKLG